MGKRALEAVLLDMDGTLVDSERLWDISLNELASRLGGTLSAETRREVVGINLDEAVRIVQTDVNNLGDARGWADWLLERTTGLFAADVRWRTGARKLVRSIRDVNIPMALVTSSYRVLTEAALARMGHALFDVVVCGDEVSVPKPDPEAYVTAASRLGVGIHNCVVIEDSPRGIDAAKASGAYVVAVPEDPTLLSSARHGSIATYSLEDITVEGLQRMTTDGQTIADVS